MTVVDSPDDFTADESEGLYKSLFDLSPLPTVVHDGRTVLRGNPAAAATFGYESAEELAGASLIAHVHPDSVPAVVERTTAMLRGESVPPLVERLLRKDGSDFVGETYASPTTWHGTPAIHVIVRDLTEVREAEAELRRSEDSYRQLFELAPDPIIVHDGETALLYQPSRGGVPLACRRHGLREEHLVRGTRGPTRADRTAHAGNGANE